MISAMTATASTDGSGLPSARATSGAPIVARSEPSDTKRVVATTATKTIADGRIAHGPRRKRSAPRPVATPLPPRNFRKTDQQLPATAAAAATAPPTTTSPATYAPTHRSEERRVGKE